MNVIETRMPGVFIIEPNVYNDDRGYFFESFSDKRFIENVCKTNFVQDNESKSTYGVLRGLHFQKPPFSQSKLVRVVSGKVLDVAVDIRKNSSTYGRHFSIELSSENKKQLFIPRGFAHGFIVLSAEAIFQYKCDNYYHAESEGSILWNDEYLNIDWLLPLDKIILSDKDQESPKLKDAEVQFNFS